jgi:two-component system chemotaxis sensor kinase CheA
MNEQDETLQIFFSETEDLLKSAEESLLTLEATPESISDVEQLFRSVHTIKSGAAMVGFMNISDYAHLLETLLERLRTHKLAVTKNLITFLLGSIDFIRSMVEGVCQGDAEADSEVLNERKSQVKRYLGLDVIDSPEEGLEPSVKGTPRGFSQQFKVYKINLKFRRDFFHSGQNPLLILLGLSELGDIVQVVPDLSELPDFKNIDIYELYISWEIFVKTERPHEELEDIFIFVKDDNDIRIEDVTKRYRDGVDIGLADKKLGEVLLERGWITSEILTDAMNKQKRLGEILVEDGKMQSEVLDKAVALQEESRAAYRKTTIRVGVEKVDSLVNLAQELGIGFSKLYKLYENYAGPEQIQIREEIEKILRVNLDFQDQVARVRMFPLEGTFRRFQRMIRDLALQQNKQINVVLKGLDTELDKEVIEHITDPLKHLVRNCIDHGIESPEERQTKGKSPIGTIEFKAYQRAGKIFVEIRDDGRGIDMTGIQKRALERGWIKPGEGLSNESLLEFIFKSGFSMSSKVTELSGRGVGMDVVKTQIDQIGGTISTYTEKDKGTTFTLCLPLTFALMETLCVRVQGSLYLIPLQAVVGTEKFNNKLIKELGFQDRMYPFRGDYLPIVDLTKIFDTGMLSGNGGASALVFVDTGRKAFGIAVNEVLESQHIIVKTLETNYRSVQGIAGATLLEDGSVSLVLDVSGLEEMLFRNSLNGGACYEGK